MKLLDNSWNLKNICSLTLCRRTNIEAELQRIKDNVAKTANAEKIKPKDLLSPTLLKPLGISMGLMFFQQFTGINSMVFYTVSIFKSAGSTINKNYATIIVGFVQLICTAASGSLVMSNNQSNSIPYDTVCLLG